VKHEKHTGIAMLKFSFTDPSHVSEDEMVRVRNMIRILEKRQTLLSEITILSEDTLCSICYAKQNFATFEPCHHQSCE
jgi:Kip1 ubiquitination-promoting complex protein 1